MRNFRLQKVLIVCIRKTQKLFLSKKKKLTAKIFFLKKKLKTQNRKENFKKKKKKPPKDFSKLETNNLKLTTQNKNYELKTDNGNQIENISNRNLKTKNAQDPTQHPNPHATSPNQSPDPTTHPTRHPTPHHPTHQLTQPPDPTAPCVRALDEFPGCVGRFLPVGWALI